MFLEQSNNILQARETRIYHNVTFVLNYRTSQQLVNFRGYLEIGVRPIVMRVPTWHTLARNAIHCTDTCSSKGMEHLHFERAKRVCFMLAGFTL